MAIPDIQTELSGSPDSVAWVVTGYTLALGAVVPISGWLGLCFGQTRLYVVSCSVSRRAPRCAGWPGTSTR